jgi:hypothetical protein
MSVKAYKAHRQAERYQSIFDDQPDAHASYLDYLGLGRQGVDLVADITPSYALLGRDTYAEMLACAEDVRFVFMMRDPVQRLWSGTGQRYRRFARAGRLTPEKKRRYFHSALKDPCHPDLLRSNYRRTITELEAAVPKDRIHYVFFESLFGDETAEVDALADFLDLPSAAFDVGEQVHAGVSQGGPDPEDIKIAARSLMPVYDFVSDRFGSRVPKSWNVLLEKN